MEMEIAERMIGAFVVGVIATLLVCNFLDVCFKDCMYC